MKDPVSDDEEQLGNVMQISGLETVQQISLPAKELAQSKFVRIALVLMRENHLTG